MHPAADHFDRLPDPVLLLVFNRIGDVKDLGRCCLVSRRFHSLVHQVDHVLVRVDCVISDPDDLAPPSSSPPPGKPRGLLSHLAAFVVCGIVRPFQALGQILSAAAPPPDPSPRASRSCGPCPHADVSHHSPAEVLREFREIRTLRIELPAGELGVDGGVLLKWNAQFGSTLHSCVILGASALRTADNGEPADFGEGIPCEEDSGSIPETFYTNGGLKMRVVWTISSLIAASARHYLLQPIIAEHGTLERLDLSDADGQGVLRMDREQLAELKVRPVCASGNSQRTLVPALNMRLWYAQQLELPGGVVLEGATLIAIRPIQEGKDVAAVGFDGGWISGVFEEPYGDAVKLLMKRRTYCLEMNSF